MIRRASTIVLAVLFSTLFAFVFYKAVFTNFYYIRYKLVDSIQSPSADGALRVSVPSEPAMEQCRLFVVKANNPSSQTVTLQFLLNQNELARASLEPNSSKKLFLRLPQLPIQDQNEFEIRGDNNAWIVEDWELRNVYKFYRGLLTWIVTDRDFRQYDSVYRITAFAAFFLFLTAFITQFSRAGVSARHQRGGHGGPPHGYFALVVFVLFAVLAALPYLSSYQVLISIKSFLLISFLVLLPALREIYRQILTKYPAKAGALRIAVVVACVVLFYFLSIRYTLWEVKGNYSGFLLLSEKFFQKNPYLRKDESLKSSLVIQERDGYDGQFFYNITFDPWLTYYKEKPNKYRNIIDLPVFRYRRIAYPLLTKLFSLDRPEFYPQTMILLLLFSHAIGAFFVAKIAIHFGRSVWWTLLYILIPGFTISLRYGLPESIAAAFLLGGIHFYLKRRILPASLFFSASLLTRETGAIVIAVICLFELWKHGRGGRRPPEDTGRTPSLTSVQTSILLGSAFVPYFLWRIYVTWSLAADTGWRAFFYEPGNFSPPFTGIAQLWYRVFSGLPTLHGPATSIFFPLLLITIFFCSIWMLRQRRDFFTVSLALYSLLAVSLDYDNVWVGVVNAERHTYESFLLLLLACLSTKSQLLPVAIFILVLIYDWCCLTTAPTFHAALLFLN